MPWYSYKALDKHGHEQSGSEEAESRGALTAALRERGLFVTEAKEGKKPAPVPPARAPAPEPPPPSPVAAQAAPARPGPPAPGMCPSCRTPKSLKEFKKLPNQGMGCLLCFIGLCLTPALIGIPIALYGFQMGGQAEIKSQCSICGWQGVPVTQERLTVRLLKVVLFLIAAFSILTLLGLVFVSKMSEEAPPIVTRRSRAHGPLPGYAVFGRKNESFNSCVRWVVNVSVDRAPTPGELEEIARNLIDQELEELGRVNAISFSFYVAGKPADGPANAGIVDWAPDGIWAKAERVEAGYYKTHRFSVQPGGQ